MGIILPISLLLGAGLSLRKMFMRLLWSLERCRATGLLLCLSSICLAVTNCCHICFYSRYERQKLIQTQPLISTGKFMGLKSTFCQKAALHVEIFPVIIHWFFFPFLFFFLLAEEALGKRDFWLPGRTAPGFTTSRAVLTALCSSCISAFRILGTPVGSQTLWKLARSLRRQICRAEVPWACQSISETMHQIRQMKEKNKNNLF